MTEPTRPADATEPATATDATGDEPTAAPQAEQPHGDGREAAKYRRQLREAQTERDALRGRVEAMQRLEVQRLAAADLAAPADLWLTGTHLDDLVDETGDVDPGKVADAVKRIIGERPGWRTTPAPPSFDGGARTPAAAPGPTYQDVLRGKGRP